MIRVRDLKSYSDEQLITKLVSFVEEERTRLHAFLSWLGELDLRKAPEKKGYSSTFDFCVRHLKLSQDEAYRRITAARAAVMRPEILTALADGHLSLSAVSRIAPHIRRPDALEIISRAVGKSARQIDEIVAPLRPVPEKRDTIRTISVISSGSSAPLGQPALRGSFSFHGSLALRDAIERIQELLSHSCPSGALEEVLLVVALDYLERHDPQKGLPGRLAPVKSGASISAPIRRAVWGRDGARCAYIGSTGVRCLSRRFLELDHIKPRAMGGDDSIANLRLLCRAHNDSERRRILGEGPAATAASAPPNPGAPSAGKPEIPGWLSGRRDPRPGSPRCASP